MYSLIRQLEFLEKAFAQGVFQTPQDETKYGEECDKLLRQYKVRDTNTTHEHAPNCQTRYAPTVPASSHHELRACVRASSTTTHVSPPPPILLPILRLPWLQQAVQWLGPTFELEAFMKEHDVQGNSLRVVLSRIKSKVNGLVENGRIGGNGEQTDPHPQTCKPPRPCATRISPPSNP